MHKIQMYENLIDMLDREAKEIESKGDLNPNTLDWLYKVTMSIKAIDKHLMCLEEKEEMSFTSQPMHGARYNMNEHSYARMGRDGDGDGRYSEDNFRYSTDRGYSRDSLLDKINYMAQSAVDEHERRVLMDCANKLR